jgi:hypothetical protein
MAEDQPATADENPEAEAEQDSFLATPVPPGFIKPPSDEDFANATWLMAGDDQVHRLLAEVREWEEFESLDGVRIETVWRRKTTPRRRAQAGDADDGDPILATIRRPDAFTLWYAVQLEETWPQAVLDLHWQHFIDARDKGSYVHEQVLLRDMHHALMTLTYTNDRVGIRAPDWIGFAATVQRFGQYTPGLIAIAKQLALWPSGEERKS